MRASAWLVQVSLWLALGSCIGPRVSQPIPPLRLPTRYASLSSADTFSLAAVPWQTYFHDSLLVALLDSALQNNQELRILLAEIEISRNEVKARTGEYLPFVHITTQADVDKVGEYTRSGAVERGLEIEPGRPFPSPLSTYQVGLASSWEIDIWKRLRNARKAAFLRYLASIEARRFAVTNLIAEVAESYYELQALDNLLAILNEYIQIQSNALQLIRLSKQAGRATQLAVNRFEARLLNTQNRRYAIQQRRTETENRLYFLLGRLPGTIPMRSETFLQIVIDTSALAGLPAQLLQNRPDIRQAELELRAAHVETQVARAAFYPSLSLAGAVGWQAFHPTVLFLPQSILYQVAAEAVTPFINRNALKAAYASATARQRQALLRYEQTLIRAYTEVLNELARLRNFSESFRTKEREVQILTESVTIANNLYRSAEADYLEVLLTQIEALDARMELIEAKMELLRAQVRLYRVLGGGWR
ncbi:MAG: TolC family protein [Bacteroidia bacterium]|nr:TolC family protein [Bacteroidia bacterium]